VPVLKRVEHYESEGAHLEQSISQARNPQVQSDSPVRIYRVEYGDRPDKVVSNQVGQYTDGEGQAETAQEVGQDDDGRDDYEERVSVRVMYQAEGLEVDVKVGQDPGEEGEIGWHADTEPSGRGFREEIAPARMPQQKHPRPSGSASLSFADRGSS